MIKDFLVKKENIFIFLIALLSIVCIVVGFLFLFLKTDSIDGPKVIPNNVYEIKWKDFSSKILDKKIQYPDYMYIVEQKESTGVGVNISEFKSREFLNYFSNQNHVSLYPDGIDNQLFYGKTKSSEYTSSNGQVFSKTEYLTVDNKVWAVMLIPKITPPGWQVRGFVWIQSSIKNKENLCQSSKGVLTNGVSCDPYSGEQPIYKGEVSDQFMRFGYEIINKNSF
jgi:hypothetical protein